MPTKRVSKKEGTTACGTHLKKGFKYVKGGGVVKVTATKKTVKKKAVEKKATAKKSAAKKPAKKKISWNILSK